MGSVGLQLDTGWKKTVLENRHQNKTMQNVLRNDSLVESEFLFQKMRLEMYSEVGKTSSQVEGYGHIPQAHEIPRSTIWNNGM